MAADSSSRARTEKRFFSKVDEVISFRSVLGSEQSRRVEPPEEKNASTLSLHSGVAKEHISVRSVNSGGCCREGR